MSRAETSFPSGQIATLVAFALLCGLSVQFTPGAWEWNDDPRRWMFATIATLLFTAFCLALALHRRREFNRQALKSLAIATHADVLPVFFASQTGQAESYARRSAESLAAATVSAHAQSLATLDAPALGKLERALFIVSTTGEGDAPDAAAGFVARVLGSATPLPKLRYGLLALGDSSYENFCAFGRQLDAWLKSQGAVPLFPIIEADDSDAKSMAQWQARLAELSGTATLPQWQEQPFREFFIVERRELNPGSLGEPVFHVALKPAHGGLPNWQAGDIAQIVPGPAITPADETLDRKPREYSIASVPAEGQLALLIRQGRRPDGSLGLGAGWLTKTATLGEPIALRLRENPNFHTPAGDIPLILIGNGTGIAALRALLHERIAQGHACNWLLFGERQRERDFFYREEVQRWHENGDLAHLDLAFSRDGAEKTYVQQRLREHAPRLREWLEAGAHLLVCGSQHGMAGGVDATLRELLGDAAVLQLTESGRYRRDVY